MCGCLLCTPYWGPGPQSRHVHWLGIEPETLWFTDWHWIHWGTPARAQLMSLHDHYQLQLFYLTVEHSPERNLQHETLQTTVDLFDQPQHLLHTLHNSFLLHFSCVFIFIGIIKHNIWKCWIFSSIFNIKMATQKFTNFDEFFFYAQIWQLSQCNLTKLFWMK